MDGVIFEDREASTTNKAFDTVKDIAEEPEAKKSYKTVVYDISIEPIKYGINLDELKSKTIVHTHEISGENFILERENNSIILTHRYWSLYGKGNNLIEAEKDLIQNAKELSSVFLNLSPSTLDSNAIELREFLFNII